MEKSETTKKINSWSSYESNRNLIVRLFNNAHKGSLSNFISSAIAITTSIASSCSESSELANNTTQLHVEETIAETLDGRKWSSLHFAAAGGNIPVIQYILETISHIANTKDETGVTPLMLAARHGNFDACKCLLKYATNVINSTTADTNSSALHFAVESGSIDIVNLLLDSGAQVDILSETSGTPIFLALLKPTSGIFEVLLQKNANLTLSSINMPPPLVFASNMGYTDIVRLMLINGADPNVRDPEGWSALQSASEAGHLEIVQLLIDTNKPCYINYTNKGKTAMDLAKEHQHSCIYDYIAQKGGYESDKSQQPVIVHQPVKSLKSKTTITNKSLTDEEKEEEYSFKRKEMPKDVQRQIESLKLKGNQKVNINDFKTALDYYKEGLKLCYPSKETRSVRSILHSNCSFVTFELKQYNEALIHAQQAIRLNPTWAKAHFRSSLAHEALKNYEEAAQAMWEAARLSELKGLGITYKNEFLRLVAAAKEKYHQENL